MPDLFFEDPLLARLYDRLEGDRSDLDVYAAMVDQFGTRSVLDLGWFPAMSRAGSTSSPRLSTQRSEIR